MELQEAKNSFIETWGEMSSQWGINRNMAQIHAMLLISHEPVCADDIKIKLQISRGSVCENLKSLMDWELIYKKHKIGDRKEYFHAEKDMWTVARRIIKHRKKKELDPILSTLDSYNSVECNCEESEEFRRMTNQIKTLTIKAHHGLERIANANSSWFSNVILKLLP
jgi:DNA-binding transcriptional regulator GbsR (MarR family)